MTAARWATHVKHVPIKEKDGRSEDYLWFDDSAGMLACVQLGTIEFHGWGSRIKPLEKPDRLVFDLDPDVGLDFAKVKDAALRLRDLLADLGLETFPLLSGGKGIHVVAPLDQTATWPKVKSFADRFARAIAEAEPGPFTANIRKAQRKGRIFLDWLRNQRGATAVMPYSARAREGAPVAAPIDWSELDEIDSAAAFTIRDADDLLERAGSKLLAGWGEAKQALPRLLGVDAGSAGLAVRPSGRQSRSIAALEVGFDAHRDHSLAEAAARLVAGARVASLGPHQLDLSTVASPVEVDLALVGAQGAIFDGVGVKLVQDHRQAEHLARLEQDFRTAVARPARRDFGAQARARRAPTWQHRATPGRPATDAPGRAIRAGQKSLW